MAYDLAMASSRVACQAVAATRFGWRGVGVRVGDGMLVGCGVGVDVDVGKSVFEGLSGTEAKVEVGACAAETTSEICGTTIG
jgi:hypothetical protein